MGSECDIQENVGVFGPGAGRRVKDGRVEERGRRITK